MISEDYDEFAYGDREAFILSSELKFDHEDSVILIRRNYNFYPSGHWVYVDLRVMECSLKEAPLDCLTPGYCLAQLNRISFDDHSLN